jgi:aldose 1-epimerase
MPLTLTSDALELTLDPDRGGGILALYARRQGLPLMPDARLPGAELGAASFLMAPYSNRVADGRFTFDGRSFELANGANHSIHGDVRKRPWRVARADQGLVHLTFRSAEHRGFNWPWPVSLEMTMTVRGPVLSTEVTLRNEGGTPMPAGMGLHPYFSRYLTREGEPVVLQFSLAGVYPDAHGTRIPSGPPEPPGPLRDFSTARPLDPSCFFDFCAHGWTGVARIAWPESGLALRLDASDALRHLVVYNPPRPWFAIEPVSNANDGFNLHARGEPTSGVRVLAPGETTSARTDLSLERC